MSTRLRGLIEALRSDVLAPHHRGIYAGARERHPALAPHEGVASVLAALADDREHTYPERDALTRTLLAEHRESGDALWASMLLVAYYPMLSRLRHRILGHTVARDDLDQLVLASFVAAVRETSPDKDRISLRLRQRTQRRVFRFIRRERAECHAGLDDRDDIPEEAAPDPHLERDTEDARTQIRLLFEAARLTRHQAEIILATFLNGERLRLYVARTVPGDARMQERSYERLKRMRTRALQKLQRYQQRVLAGAA
jgi:hypothetical protein